MPVAIRNTVDRLDTPSAYYLGRVGFYIPILVFNASTHTDQERNQQNKNRKYGNNRDDEDERERTPEEPEDPLKDATTLYVGNLSVKSSSVSWPLNPLANVQQVVLHNRGTDTRAFCKVCFHFFGYRNMLTDQSRCGEIKRLVMGLNRNDKTPCGFCFVEYYTHQDALDCMKYIGGTKLDERIIRTDLDPGFQEGRQYGYVCPPMASCLKVVEHFD